MANLVNIVLSFLAIFQAGEKESQNNPVWADKSAQVTYGSTGTDADEADRMAVAELKAQGSDITKPTNVIFYLYFQKRSQAEALKGQITSLGFQVDIHKMQDYDLWTLAANKTMVPSENNVISLGHQFTAMASSEGGKYDGWEAAHVK